MYYKLGNLVLQIGAVFFYYKLGQTLLQIGAASLLQIRQNTWFLENNRALSKFLYGILHYLISTIKL